jgi:formylmethanofuran dehydrogenase subunit E
MKNGRITLEEAVEFHGHLGPWLVLGILIGELALKKLKVKKYFDLHLKVYGANRKPRSCLIDGLQLSTGATYGKGNIQKIKSNKIKVVFCNLKNDKMVRIYLREDFIKKIDDLRGRRVSEIFAKELYKSQPTSILNPKFALEK